MSLTLKEVSDSIHIIKASGTRYHSGMSQYQGEWKNEMRHGEGTFVDALGNKYTGTWENNRL